MLQMPRAVPPIFLVFLAALLLGGETLAQSFDAVASGKAKPQKELSELRFLIDLTDLIQTDKLRLKKIAQYLSRYSQLNLPVFMSWISYWNPSTRRR